ncbi:hypothetical protein [Mycolicibacterium fortuitum]|uniref:hypothetical protein n=1 Tax=Mycolicibacterium fortuitum TaxID=1766 RepID=UPI0007EC0988|nr:hypothetical protein [Mycolicibacterium fortuitum]OBF77059.1 hypothetical protein A5751_23040 [Mycolicibacterium fortuitum]
MIPPPTPPPPLELEDVDSIPDQAHDWGREWESDYHSGRVCNVCGENSECLSCYPNSKALEEMDCLRAQAEDRNFIREREHRAATARYEAQMDYYREITKGADS